VTGESSHRELREMLGAHVLGGLTPEESVRLGAHLDGCPACRAELVDLRPLADDLRLVDPARLPGPPAPPRDLGSRVLTAVREESVLRDARERRAQRGRRVRAVLVPVAAAAVAAVVAGTVAVRVTAPEEAPAPVVAVEQLALTVLDGDVQAAGPAVVVPHTWGVEVTFAASGFEDGRTYRALVRTADGRVQPAGEFLGVGAKELECDMQAAVLRPDARQFEVVDDTGEPVLTLAL